MTTFRVGQRIKKVRGLTNVGTVATVVRTDIAGDEPETLEVKRDASWVNAWGAPMPASQTSRTDPANWEPLTDSYDLVTWESMRDLWMPEHLREVA